VRQLRVEPDTARMAQFGVRLDEVETALRDFAANTSGGFIDLSSREYLIRNLGRTTRIDDLSRLAVAQRDGRPVLLEQIATVWYAPALKRGDAGFNTLPAVIVSVQKQPSADTVRLTGEIEQALTELKQGLPKGLSAPEVLFRQATFIEASIGNVVEVLRDGAIMVAIVLFAFLLSARTTLISLIAIPLSLAVTGLVFHLLGQSINVMTLGCLAIAIGELVDDAVVDVENILRRLKQNRTLEAPLPSGGRAASVGGGAFRHRLRDADRRAGVRAAVRAAGHRGTAVRAARRCLHRLDPGVDAGVDDRHARAVVLSVAAHASPRPWR
jgi:Cu/Ag efflux pump CusA